MASLDPLAAFRLDDRVVAVTGASSGLGARFARVAAAAGASVVAAARREDRLEELCEELRARGSECVGVACDVTREADLRELATAAGAQGRIDVLVAAAGIAPDADEPLESLESFRRVLEVNATGLYGAIRAVAPAMLERGSGSIVNVASISGLVAGDGPDTPSYAASKGAVVNLTRELAVRWASAGIRVNAIAPGWFESEMTEATLASAEGRRFVAERTPMGRPGAADELDGAFLYLASDASRYVTGHTLVVDGGWTAR
ncbi:MAG: glucose 1-dehydrogenase [Actinomycetota bacterium]|nr:glucose 1-dehydrogenase [Actinomycetota bacterium]